MVARGAGLRQFRAGDVRVLGEGEVLHRHFTRGSPAARLHHAALALAKAPAIDFDFVVVGAVVVQGLAWNTRHVQ